MPNRALIHRRRGVLVVAALLAASLVFSACSDSDAGSGPRQGDPVTWTKVELPAGEEPVTLTAKGADLLIGVQHKGAKVVPGLTIRSADGKFTPIPVKPTSPYAFLAVWQSVAINGTTVVALGGAPGGAHSNVRYTVWTGTTSGLIEHPQEFNTFGGQTAGNVIGAVMAPGGSALLGSWGSDISGLDAAVWLPQGEKWIRQKVAGTALQSKADLLVGPTSGTVSGDSIVIAGSQVRLGPNLVEQHAALWRSTQLNQGWSRLELPDGGARSDVRTITCTATVCLASGYADGKLAIWKIEGSQRVAVSGRAADRGRRQGPGAGRCRVRRQADPGRRRRWQVQGADRRTATNGPSATRPARQAGPRRRSRSATRSTYWPARPAARSPSGRPISRRSISCRQQAAPGCRQPGRRAAGRRTGR